MKLETIRLSHFGSHAATELAFAPLSLVVGPNGAGKTTLASKAVRFALFGDEAGDLDQLVQYGEEYGQVELVFTVKGTGYRIIRGRSRKGRGQSKFELDQEVVDGRGWAQWKPLTGGSIAETQARLEAILKLDYRAFVNTVMIVQGDPGFTSRKPTERKQVLASILRLEETYAPLKEAALKQQREWEDRAVKTQAELEQAQHASEDLAPMEALLDSDRKELHIVQSDLAITREEQETVQQRIEELREVKGQAAGATATLKELQQQRTAVEKKQTILAGYVTQLEGELATRPQVEERLAVLAKLRERQADFISNRHKWDDLNAQLRAADVALATARGEYESWSTEQHFKLQQTKEAVGRLNNSECPIIEQKPQCVFLRDAHQAVFLLPELEASVAGEPPRLVAVKEARDQLDQLGRAHKALGYDTAEHLHVDRQIAALQLDEVVLERLKQGGGQLEKWTQEQAVLDTDRGRLSERIQQLQEELGALEEARGELTGSELRRVQLGGKAADLATTERQLLDEIAGSEQLFARLLQEVGGVERLQEALAAARREALWHQQLARAFSNDGIPALVIDNIVADLARVADDLLAKMPASGGLLHVELRTQRDLKSGTGVRETLDIVVRVGNRESPFEELSGGEKVRVEFALRMALSRVLAHRAGASIDTLIVDEGGMGALDEDGVAGLVEAIRSVQPDFAVVVVISHEPKIIEAGWPSVVRVTRENGSSVVAVE